MKMPELKSVSANLLNCGIVIVSVMFGILYYLAPFNTDDLWYMCGAFDANGVWDSFLISWKNALAHLDYDTGRFANLMAIPCLTLLPKWMWGIMQAGIIASMFLLVFRLSEVSRCSLCIWLGFAALIFILPWFDSMISIDFSINYVWSGLFMLLGTYWFYRTVSGKIYGRFKLMAIMIVLIVIGWFHEGFTMALLMAMGVWILLCRFHIPRQAWIVALSVLTGFLLLLVFPATWHRNAEFENLLGMIPFREAAFNVIAFNFAFYIYIASIALTFIIPSFRAGFSHLPEHRKSLVWFLLAGSVASFTLFCMRYLGPRIAWPEILYSTIGCLILWSCWPVKTGPVFHMIVSAVVLTASFINLGWAIGEQYRLREEYDVIVRKYLESPNGTVYFDQIKPAVNPALMKSSIRNFNAQSPIRNFSRYYCPDKNILTLVPSVLSDMRWHAVPVSFSSPEARIFNGHIMIAGDKELADNVIEIKRGKEWKKERVWLTDFVTSDNVKVKLVRMKLFTQLDSEPVTDVRLDVIDADE